MNCQYLIGSCKILLYFRGCVHELTVLFMGFKRQTSMRILLVGGDAGDR